MTKSYRVEAAWLVQNGTWTSIENPLEEAGDRASSIHAGGYHWNEQDIHEGASLTIGTDARWEASVYRATHPSLLKKHQTKAPHAFLVVINYNLSNSITCFVFCADFPSLLQVLSMVASVSNALMV